MRMQFLNRRWAVWKRFPAALGVSVLLLAAFAFNEVHPTDCLCEATWLDLAIYFLCPYALFVALPFLWFALALDIARLSHADVHRWKRFGADVGLIAILFALWYGAECLGCCYIDHYDWESSMALDVLLGAIFTTAYIAVLMRRRGSWKDLFRVIGQWHLCGVLSVVVLPAVVLPALSLTVSAVPGIENFVRFAHGIPFMAVWLLGGIYRIGRAV